MSFPNFYNPKNASNWGYNPSLRALFEASTGFRVSNNISFAASSKRKVALMPIDMQKDFCLPEGTLYVAGLSGTGAIDDSRRMAEFIYREMNQITSINVTMDTHEAIQIFTPSFWLDENGVNVQPHDMIDGDLTIHRGKTTVGKAKPAPYVASMLGASYTWLLQQVQFYCKKVLEGGHSGKYMLYIWPEHTVLGSEGHNLVGIIQEARMFHSYVRGVQNSPQIKGGNPLSENYSIFSPEVTDRFDGKGALAQRNVSFLKTLLDNDAVIIGGEASSHCVKSSIDDLLNEILTNDKSLAKKVYILEDCMSPVVIPGYADFSAEAANALQKFADAGMNIVKSTDPMDRWLKV